MKTVNFAELGADYGSVEHDATAEAVLAVVDEQLARFDMEIVQGESFDDCHQFTVRNKGDVTLLGKPIGALDSTMLRMMLDAKTPQHLRLFGENADKVRAELQRRGKSA